MAPASISLTELPDAPGIYRFYGDNDNLLYIGKSVRLRQRVRSHFVERPVDSRHGRMQRQVRRIDWTETAGELGALLMEAEEIKRRAPLFNRRLRRVKGLCIALLDPAPESPRPVTLHRADAPHELEPSRVAGLFRNQHTARNHLEQLVREQGLCPRLLGIESGPPGRPCFQHQLRRCRGACCDRESLSAHNRRLRDALHASRLGIWPWPGAALIRESRTGHRSFHVIAHWCYLGSAATRREAVRLVGRETNRNHFDLDLYRILVDYFERKGDRLEIEPATTARPA